MWQQNAQTLETNLRSTGRDCKILYSSINPLYMCISRYRVNGSLSSPALTLGKKGQYQTKLETMNFFPLKFLADASNKGDCTGIIRRVALWWLCPSSAPSPHVRGEIHIRMRKRTCYACRCVSGPLSFSIKLLPSQRSQSVGFEAEAGTSTFA